MATHFLDIKFPKGEIAFYNEYIDISTKGLIFMSKKHANVKWDQIEHIIIEQLEDSAVTLKIKITGNKELSLSMDQELNIKKRNIVRAQLDLLNVYYNDKK